MKVNEFRGWHRNIYLRDIHFEFITTEELLTHPLFARCLRRESPDRIEMDSDGTLMATYDNSDDFNPLGRVLYPERVDIPPWITPRDDEYSIISKYLFFIRERMVVNTKNIVKNLEESMTYHRARIASKQMGETSNDNK